MLRAFTPALQDAHRVRIGANGHRQTQQQPIARQGRIRCRGSSSRPTRRAYTQMHFKVATIAKPCLQGVGEPSANVVAKAPESQPRNRADDQAKPLFPRQFGGANEVRSERVPD